MNTPMTPRTAGSFVDGPSLEPSTDLLAWLENDVAKAAGRKRIRLPVVAVWEDEYRLSFGAVFVGTSAPAPSDAIHLSLDDTPMGLGIIDTLADSCPEGDAACAVWLEGYWGELVPGMPDFDMGDEGPKKWPFAVLALSGAITGEARAQVAAD